MIFSYLEPVLHKAQLVLGGGLCFGFFFLTHFLGLWQCLAPKLNPLECPLPRGGARQTSVTPEVVAFRHKKGQPRRALLF